MRTADGLELKRARDCLADYEEWRELKAKLMREIRACESVDKRTKLILQASMAEERATKSWNQLDKLKRGILRDLRVPHFIVHKNREAIASAIDSGEVIGHGI